MQNSIIPLPSILNESSFGRFSTKANFISAVTRLVDVLKKMRLYGFAAQVGCSSALMERVCYDTVTFREWLRLPNGMDVSENEARNFIRLAVSKVPRLEEGYALFNEAPDFDLLWEGKVLYVNPERTIPAFVIAVCFGMPTIALKTGVFADSFIHRPVIRELEEEGICERTESVYSFSDIAQIDVCDDYLKKLIGAAVVDEDSFSRIRDEMFPNLVFSHEVEAALAQHRVNFRAIPVLKALIRLQRAILIMCERNICFEDAYGRVSSLAMNESATVRQKCPESRRFTWDDGSRFCFPHVKIGGGFRLYFVPDKRLCKVYVGYMGEHLPL